jgi:undecaprenyl-diphosphooligosaccharide--protein glycosyltransferase
MVAKSLQAAPKFIKNSLSTPMKHNFFIFLIVTLICYGYSGFVRYEQYTAWKGSPAKYFANETPMMTTLDSYFWLRWAKEYKEGTILEGKDQLRNFPDGKRSQHPVPLISYLIAKVAPSFDDNYYRSGFFLMMALSGAFIFPLALYFYFLGYPIAGILGGLIGTVSYEYFIRTGIGRVDTDSLMLFFLFSISVFILKASEARSTLYIWVYSCLGGAFTYLLTLWWGKPAFVLPFIAVLFVSLLLPLLGERQKLENEPKAVFIIKRSPFYDRLTISALASVLFFSCAIGLNLSNHSTGKPFGTAIHYLENYIQMGDEIEVSESEGGGAAFPNILKTIKEVKRLPIKTTLGHLLTSPTLSAIGLVGFLFFVFAHWRKLLPILLIFAVGLLSFQGARRFAMFLGPFVGIGYGYLITIVLTTIYQNIPFGQDKSVKPSSHESHRNSVISNQGASSRYKEFSSYGIALLVFFGLSSYTAIGRVPKPSIPAPTFRTFLELKDSLPKDSVIYTWWDYGYALTDVMDVATFHDGGSQTYPKTFFIAKSFTSREPRELHNTISYLTAKGAKGITRMIDENASHQELVANVLEGPTTLDHQSVYLMFTKDQVRKFRTIHSIGQWSFEKEQLGKRIGYKNLKCDQLKEFELRCRNRFIDLKKGEINNVASIKSAIIIDNGYVERRIRYSNNDGKYLQILTKEGKLLAAQIVTEKVYQSNFNQMYLLGQYDPNLFYEVYNSFPWTRVFHVKTPAQNDTPR